jgi:hypothetical protein
MKRTPQLDFLLEGVTDAERRETLIAAFHSLGGDDPESFPVQFAILGAAIAARIEFAVTNAQRIFEHAERLEFNPGQIAESIAAKIPSFKELTTIREDLRTAVANIPRGLPQDRPKGGELAAVAIVIGVLNLALLLFVVFSAKLL